jgi:hypothetical protein
MLQYKFQPSIGVPCDNTGVRGFQALSISCHDGRHNMTKGNLIVDVYPETTMISEGAEDKFKISTSNDIQGRRSTYAINWNGPPIEGSRAVLAVSCEQHLAEPGVLEGMRK